jgi:hypothetical protein
MRATPVSLPPKQNQTTTTTTQTQTPPPTTKQLVQYQHWIRARREEQE